MNVPRTLLWVCAALPWCDARAAVDFEREVWPILEASCVECHGAPYEDASGRLRKPKGGLRVDGREHLLAGSAVVPGDPEGSLIYEYITLDADDPDLMPQDGPPLSRLEIERIRRWIDEGADYGDWVGANDGVGAPVASLPARFEPIVRLSVGLKPVASEVLADVASGRAQVREVVPGHALYRVQFYSNEAEIDDAALRTLRGIDGQVAELILARCSVTDRGLETVRRMQRLVRLDLRQTDVGDQGVRHLGGLEELRTLNLHATQVTDASIDLLVGLPSLEKVHLYGTRVTAEGAAELRQRRPDVEVHHRLELPVDR